MDTIEHPCVPGYRLIANLYSSDSEPATALYLAQTDTNHANQSPKHVLVQIPNSQSTVEHEKEILLHLKQHARGVHWQRHIATLEDAIIFQNGLALILRNPFGEETLRSNTQERLRLLDTLTPLPTIKEFFRVAIQATEALITLHDCCILHNDINPSHLLYDDTKQEICLFGFSRSAILTASQPQIPMESTMSPIRSNVDHIAPEQTGCLERKLDFRTDIYNLGSTFYALITGKPVFQYDSPIRVIVSHLSKKPAPVVSPYFHVPQSLRDIVEKMLQKEPSERYQTAYGLLRDLKRCKRLAFTKKYDVTFQLGHYDKAGVFKLPSKLYGRKAELQALRRAYFELSNSKEASFRMLLVTGEAGSGKTALISELAKEISRDAFFVSGRFQQLHQDIPYLAVTQACNQILERVLMMETPEFQEYKELILKALGSDVSSFAAILPKICAIAGPQTPPVTLCPTESELRVLKLLSRFILAIASKKLLVLFIDDLQWADAASLKLLHCLADSPTNQSGRLLIIGAYRDNETDETHKLRICLNTLSSLIGSCIQWSHLEPLRQEDVIQLLGDSMNTSNYDSCKELASLVHSKTGGSPFFIMQFLKSLCTKSMLNYNQLTGLWHWNVQQILENEPYTENVVMFMISKIRALQPQTIDLLQKATLLGSNFHQNLLAKITELSVESVELYLQEAIWEGLLIQSEEGKFKFSHDRVQQAAYTMMEEDIRIKEHIRVGTMLLDMSQSDSAFEYSIFEIVGHLNHGIPVLANVKDVLRLVELNTLAAQIASQMMAFDTAFSYLNHGLQLLGMVQDSWETCYSLCFDLYFELGQNFYFVSNLTRAEEVYNTLAAHVTQKLDLAKLAVMRIRLYETWGRYNDGLIVGQQCLAQFGVDLSLASGTTLETINELSRNIDNLCLQDVLRWPEPDNLTEAILGVLCQLCSTTYFIGEEIFAIVATQSCHLHITKRIKSKYIAVMFIHFGIIRVESGYLDQGLKWAKFGKELSNSMKEFSLVVAYLHAAFIAHLQSSYRRAERESLSAFQKLVAASNIGYAAYCGSLGTAASFFAGDKLEVILQRMVPYEMFCRKYNCRDMDSCFAVLRRTIEQLLGRSDDEEVDEQLKNTIIQDRTDGTKSVYYMFETFVRYFFGDYQEALKAAFENDKYVWGIRGLLRRPEHDFLKCIALSANIIAFHPHEEDKLRWLQEIKLHRQKLLPLTKRCPYNYECKYLLISAELARIEGKIEKALVLYSKAIQCADKQKMYHIALIVCERLVTYFCSLNLFPAAKGYFDDAVYYCSLWGSYAKLKQLYNDWPELWVRSLPESPSIKSDLVVDSKNATTEKTLYLPQSELTESAAFLLKTFEALSKQFILPKLLFSATKLIRNATEADHVLLLLAGEHGEFTIEAEGSKGKVVVRSKPIEKAANLAISVIQCVIRTTQPIGLSDVINQRNIVSVVCTPIKFKNDFMGIIYFEMRSATQKTVIQRMNKVNLLSSYLGNLITNGQLYEAAQQHVVSLERLDRVKDDFLANSSHELRTPLFGIMGALDTLEKTNLSSEQKDFVNLASMCSNELSVHVENLLDFMKLQHSVIHVKEEQFGLFECIENALSLVCYRAAIRDIEMAYVVSPFPFSHFIGDAFRIKQVLLNLLINAVKYNKERGSILISVEIHQTQEARCNIEFVVSDTGVGIDQMKWKELFQPFQQIENDHSQVSSGSGLGLSVSQKIAQILKGSLHLKESNNDIGSTFVFKVPVSIDQSIVMPRPRVHNFEGHVAVILAFFQTNEQILEFHLREMGIGVHLVNTIEQLNESLRTSQKFSIVIVEEKCISLIDKWLLDHICHIFVLCGIIQRVNLASLTLQSPRYSIIDKPIKQSKLQDHIEKELKHLPPTLMLVQMR